MPTSEGANIEAKIRHTTQTKRIRVSEFFKDYDPLRSGFISGETPSHYTIVYCLRSSISQLVIVFFSKPKSEEPFTSRQLNVLPECRAVLLYRDAVLSVSGPAYWSQAESAGSGVPCGQVWSQEAWHDRLSDLLCSSGEWCVKCDVT